MLTIEKEIDLVIDLKSANTALIQNKDIRAFYQDALGEDGWEGILAVKGEDFVIANMNEDYWDGQYSASVAIEREGYDFNDDPVTLRADSFADLTTWQTVSRFIEDGYFIVRVEDEDDDDAPLRFKVSSGRAEQL